MNQFRTFEPGENLQEMGKWINVHQQHLQSKVKHVYLIQTSSHHETCMADVPGESHHGPFLGIHYRVLDDVGLACNVAGQKLFCPAWCSAGFGQESSGNEAIISSHLPKDDVFCQHMITREKRENYLGLRLVKIFTTQYRDKKT